MCPSHGTEIHNAFHVTGIMERTGTPNDRAAFINVEGFFKIADHALGAEEEAAAAEGSKSAEPAAAPKASDLKPSEDEVLKEPVAEEKRGVTAILVRGAGELPELMTRDLARVINKEPVAQAILPIEQISIVTGQLVEPFQWILLALTVLIVVVAGVGILVSIYNSMSERRHEIAVMRALGARPGNRHAGGPFGVNPAGAGRRAGWLGGGASARGGGGPVHCRLYWGGGRILAVFDV